MNIQILLLLMLIIQNKKNDRRNVNNKALHSLNNYIENMEIDVEYTEQKINMVKRITPLMPEEYIPPFVKSVVITEALVKLIELKKHLEENEDIISQRNVVPVKDNRERLKKIISIIQEEAPKSSLNNRGMLMDMIINLDQYKKMFEMFNSFMNNKDGLNDPENLVKLVGPLLSGKDNGPNAKELAQMMNIMKALTSSDKKDTKKDTQKSTNKDVKEEVKKEKSSS